MASPKKRKLCRVEGCDKGAQAGGVCVKHGAVMPRCRVEGCENGARAGGVCVKHGAVRSRCRVEGCENRDVAGGVCVKHGAVKPRCRVEGCENGAQAGGVCVKHGAVKPRCRVEGCENQAHIGGVCKGHDPERPESFPFGSPEYAAKMAESKRARQLKYLSLDAKLAEYDDDSCFDDPEHRFHAPYAGYVIDLGGNMAKVGMGCNNRVRQHLSKSPTSRLIATVTGRRIDVVAWEHQVLNDCNLAIPAFDVSHLVATGSTEVRCDVAATIQCCKDAAITNNLEWHDEPDCRAEAA